MTCLPRLIVLACLAPIMAGCQPPSYQSAHPDALHSGPFWEREEQRN